MGHFYNLPPAFIGGAQPYAPRLGIPQSGPAPTPPPPNQAAIYQLILSIWWPPTRSTKSHGGPDIVPPVSSVPPAITIPSAIFAWWAHDPMTIITLPSAAGAPGPPPPDQPPPVSQANMAVILKNWDLGPQILPPRPTMAALIPLVVPDAPPVNDRRVLFQILRMWDPPFFQMPPAATIAPFVPIPPPPPPVPQPSPCYPPANLRSSSTVPPIVLLWDTVGPAVSYNIYRNNTLIGNVLAPITTFTDPNVVTDEHYRYVVTGINFGGQEGPGSTPALEVHIEPSGRLVFQIVWTPTAGHLGPPEPEWEWD